MNSGATGRRTGIVIENVGKVVRYPWLPRGYKHAVETAAMKVVRLTTWKVASSGLVPATNFLKRSATPQQRSAMPLLIVRECHPRLLLQMIVKNSSPIDQAPVAPSTRESFAALLPGCA